jgi:hypothetical protein
MSPVDELARLVQWDGQGARGIDWSVIENALGVSVPASFKEYVERFPRGEFQTYLSILQPDPAAGPSRYLADVRLHEEVLRAVAGDTADFPYAVHPEIPGLLPWGYIGTDEIFCWHISHEEVEPQLVVVDVGDATCEILGTTMANYLVDILAGRVPRLRWLADECQPPRFGRYRAPGEQSAP